MTLMIIFIVAFGGVFVLFAALLARAGRSRRGYPERRRSFFSRPFAENSFGAEQIFEKTSHRERFLEVERPSHHHHHQPQPAQHHHHHHHQPQPTHHQHGFHGGSGFSGGGYHSGHH